MNFYSSVLVYYISFYTFVPLVLEKKEEEDLKMKAEKPRMEYQATSSTKITSDGREE